jgi:S-ribosylhomocysteine lyase LuxS involved in autoinducer biosynthesis
MKIKDLVLEEVMNVNYMHCLNHLMAMEIATHMQMHLAMVLHLMLQVKTCLQTKRMEISQ